jgi:polyisoprenyl-phosphate glycosyltransferase
LEARQPISVILPIYNEAEGIFKNTLAIKEILDKNEISHEFLFVDDGSQDQTWLEIQKLQPLVRFKAIRLSRNFGKESAIMAGIVHVSTTACVIMDADLQHPPQKIVEMYQMWTRDGFEIIDGIKKSRGKESFLYRCGAMLFYKMFSSAIQVDMHQASDFKFLDGKVIDALKGLTEKETFFRGLSTWVGFKRGRIEFEVEDRNTGSSSWSFVRLFKLAIGAMTSFTSLPLHMVTAIGMLVFFVSVALGIHTLYMKFSGLAVSGFTTVILLLLIIGSAMMLSLGIIGVYIEKIYNEIKGRPRYIVREILNVRDEKEEDSSKHDLSGK